MPLHLSAPLGDRHAPYNWEYADETARLAASGFTAEDVGRLALQLNTMNLYMLIATTPTWQLVSVDIAAQVPDGGTTGQVLKKASDDDFDTEWDDESGGGGGGSGLTNYALGINYTITGSPHSSYPDRPVNIATDSSGFTDLGGTLNNELKGNAVYSAGNVVGWQGVSPVITYDLGTDREIQIIKVYGLLDSPTGIYQPSAVKIEYSDNGSSWNTEVNTISLAAGSGIATWLYNYVFSSPSTHRYWRVTVTYQTDWVMMTEIEILGT
jgi:hypothetical protein